MDYKNRYIEAHKKHCQREYPNVWKDGLYAPPKFPAVQTANGMQTFIVNYLTWTGCYGNRINTTGRQIFDKKKGKHTWIKGSTKKGTGDILACLPGGRMVFFEVKAGKDIASAKQEAQQAKITAVGGGYYFIHSVEEFLQVFDELTKN